VKKKLIEVALPLDKINAAAAREKNIRFGHPSTLHLWWARRPLAACRAVLFASLVDDPSAHPDQFPTDEAQKMERDRLFAILEEIVQWKNSTDESVLSAARREIMRSTGGDPPAIYDPFCGGGSIPLEAQRLGLRAYGSDLNPIPVLITKAMIELPMPFVDRPAINPDSSARRDLVDWKGLRGLTEDVRYYGNWMRERALESIGKYYPKVKLKPDQGEGEATVIAWLWARTVQCPNPACGGRMPLIRSLYLSTKKGKEAWLEPIVDKASRSVRFEIRTGSGAVPESPKLSRGANFRCLICSEPASDAHIKAEGSAGRMSAQMTAIVADTPSGRFYLPANDAHVQAASAASSDWRPEEAIANDPRNLWCINYGLRRFCDLFTERQLVALTTYSRLVQEARARCITDGASELYANAIATYLALGVSRLADISNALCVWETSKTQARHLFLRQAIPMLWDFAETNVFGDAAGDYAVSLGNLVRVIEALPVGLTGSVRQAEVSATEVPSRVVFSTDPPYYDNISYADLSDFFYVWLRRSLRNIYPELFGTLLVPKSDELVANPYRFNGDGEEAQRFFQGAFGRAFTRLRRAQNPDFPLTVFYAFKQSEAEDDDSGGMISSAGWETMLDGLLRSGFQVTATWPVRSEASTRPIADGTNALASSIVLACRPRAEVAPVITEMGFQQALRSELPKSLRTMQQESIAPVDLAQAAIGPGMAIFSQYSKVLGPDGNALSVRKALEMINRVLDEVLSEQEGEFDSETRFALAWFQQFGMRSGTFGTADVLSRAMNIGVTGMENAGILEAKAGTVRLLKWEELPEDWDPEKDRRLTVWEMTHHLIRLMYKESDTAAARLLTNLGGEAEKARDLAYRLYQICERSKRSQEAQPYNALVVAWPNLTAEARQMEKKASTEQLTL
jgi:putative DNA methylase